ncbi:MAG TPA: HD domain-containing phosphohydrolase [Thermoanaerobaculia bacterium]|jgi:HD-GYP domain-containing protein (c-di-GMP phosphodiesterase class II)
MATRKRSPLDAIQLLTSVGRALSAEKSPSRLMELILRAAKDLTGADGGTLYSRGGDPRAGEDHLKFEILLTDSLGLRLGGAGGGPIDYPPLPLYGPDGEPNKGMVAARAALGGMTVNIRDAYDAPGFDFSGTREFDRKTGYRSKSFLTVPMKNHEDEVIGVLQLINARDGAGEVGSFTLEDQRLVESLASQAAITLTKERLIDEHRRLFEAFAELIAAAIDDKSPFTGSHCRRVPELTMMLADAADASRRGPLAGFRMSPEDRYELRIASWLHDCGKVATPEWIIDKATKLTAIHDRLETIDARFAVLRQQARAERLRAELAARERGERVDREVLDECLRQTLAELDDERRFLSECNLGGEYMSRQRQERVREIGRRRWTDASGVERPLLTGDEIYNLNISRGTLNPEERAEIRKHIDTTIKMLESLPYPKSLMRVPEFAGGHHERMDGKGYPRGLTREQMSIQARMMGIADVFEALTARDRPYKRAMPLSQALAILGRMKEESHIDPDLFDVFIREKVYLRYAEQYLDPQQIDDVDLSRIPGAPADALEEERVPLKKAG